MIGSTLGHYTILEKLGEGGMGEVYRATDTKLGREVAIKVLPEEVAADPERLARFEQEARTLAALDHSSIVTIYSVETADDMHFLTMQLIEGDTLDRRILAEGLSIDRMFDYAVPIAEALAAAHDRGITHRDLKPANVMVTTDGRVKVLDFGLAKIEAGAAAGEDLPTLAMTREGMVMGTAPYMSPEQAKGIPVDARSDVFSLGIVLYEMATGVRPFQGDTSADLVSSILRDTPQQIGEVRADLPNHLRRVISRCLEKEPGQRYQTASDVAIELRGLQREWHSGEVTPGSGSPAAVSAVPTVSATPIAAVAESELAIGVLPINCSTDDAEVLALAEGLSEDLTTGLARFSYLSVVIDPVLSGDARYQLTGRIRRAGSVIRANLHILDAITGGHLWAEAYDRNLEGSSLFEIQDELADSVVATIADQQGVLIRAMCASIRDKPVDQLSALEAVFLAFDYLHEITPEAHARIREMLERVVESEPDSAGAWAALSEMYCEEYKHDYNVRPDSLGRAIAAARRAISVDRTHQLAYHSLAVAQFFRRDLAAFKSAAERAVQLNPRNGNTLAFMGILHNYAGDWDKGTPLIRRALELNPNHPHWYRFGIFYDHFRQGQFEEALAEAQSIDMPGYYPTLVSIGAAAGYLGRTDVASSAVEELLKLYPAFAERGRAEYSKWVRDETVLDSVFEGLRLAGLAVADAKPTPPATASTADPATVPSSSGSADTGIAVQLIEHDVADADLAALAQGLTESVTTGLTRFSYLKVIEDAASRPVSETTSELGRVAQSLGARYLLSGALRRAGNALRLNVRVVDTTTGQHLWSENFDRRLDESNLFDIQDELTDRIVGTVADSNGVLARSMAAAIRERPTDTWSADEWILRAAVWVAQLKADEQAMLRDGLEAVVEREPMKAEAWAWLAAMYIVEYQHRLNPRDQPLERALAAAQRAVDIDPTSQAGWVLVAESNFHLRDVGRFQSAAERAMGLNPRDTHFMGVMGMMIAFSGEWERGIEINNRTMKLNPHHPGWLHFTSFYDLFRRREYEEALRKAKMIQMPDLHWYWWVVATLSGHLGRESDALIAKQNLQRLGFDDLELAREDWDKWMHDAELAERLLDGLRKAGIGSAG